MSLRMSSRAYGRVRFAQLAVLAIVLSAIAFALPSSAAAEPLCTDTWTGAAEGNWSTVTNWSAGHAPSSSDVACIGAGKVAVVSSGSNTAAVVQGAGGVSVSGGTLTVVSALEASSIASLRVSGGTLGGAASISVSSSFVWSEAGTLAGKGQTIIASGASATLEGATCSSLFLVERKLLNEGSATFTGTNIRMSEGAVLENKGTFTANSESSCLKYAFINEGGTAAPKIVNSGTLRKTSGSGSTIEAVALENHGTVEAATGKLVLHGGGSANASGTFIGATGAVLQFAEGAFALAASTWKGQIELANPGATVSTESLLGTAATVVQTTGTWLLSGSSTTVESFSLISGELAGAGTLVVAKSFLWESGTMAGAGTTVVGSGATGAIEGPSCGTAFLIKRTFENAGTLTFKGEMLRMQEAALFENTGVFRANSESTCLKYAIISEPVPSEPHKESLPGESAFVNVGTFEKTEGTGTTIVEAPFEAFGSPPVAHTGKFEFIKPFTRELSASYGGAESLEPGQTCSCAGEPVLVTGDFLERQSDLSVGGRGVGMELARTYNSQAAAEGAKGTFGYGWSNSFSEKLVIDKEHHLATFYRAGGGTVAFKESGGTYTPPATSRYSLAGSTEAGYTLTAPDQTVYKFSGTSGRLESITDRNGNATTLAYGGTGRLETITDPVGRKLTLAYNAEGLVETAKDPMGHTVKYTYEGGNLATVTEPGEATARWSFKYDGSHQATEMIDGRGGVLVNEYNAAHQVIKQTDPLKHVTKFTYEPFNVRVLNESTGSETSESYTSNFESASTTNGYGTAIATTTLRTYNAGGYLTSETDGNGHTTKYGYNAANDRTSETDPEGDETKWEYNAAHFVVSTTTPKGETTTIERDAHGNALKVSRPAPASKTQATKYKYTAHGELELATELLEPGERTTTYEYNSHGDRTAEIDPEKDKRTWGYNEDSFETSMVSPNGHVEGAKESKFTTTITRDEQNRATLVTAPLKHETKYAYDANGNLESVTDPELNKTKYTYDADNQLTRVEAPSGAISETEYDAAGRVIAQIDGNKHKTEYKRNVLGEVYEVIDPLARKTTKEYDAAGNLKAVTDAKGRTTTYTYDTANRLTKIVYSDGKTPEVKYEYDKDSSRTKMIDGTGIGTYEYDQLERLTATKDGHGDSVAYEYNLANEPIKITYPSGKAITRGYDNDGRLSSVTDWAEPERTTKFAYDADSNLKKTTFPTATGNEDTYAYDEADNMSELTLAKGVELPGSIVYTRNKDGQVTKETAKGVGGEEKPAYSYDENSRLTKGRGIAYKYDAANNPTTIGSEIYSYDAASQLEKAETSKKVTTATYAYNEVGQRTKHSPVSGEPATTYGNDQVGNLTSVTRPEGGTFPKIEDSYGYDGDGLRASQTISGTTTFMTWDVAESLPLLLGDGTNSYIYGPRGLPVEQVNNSTGATLFLHHDQQGSTRILTEASGLVGARYAYDGYGNLFGISGAASTPMRYDGQYTSSDTGLVYLRNRVYDPTTAQFLTQDPLEAITREPYSYAGDDPLNYSDPTGLFLGIPGTPSTGEIVGAIGEHFGQIVAVTAGGVCIVASAGVCAGAIVIGGVANAGVIAAKGGSADEQVLNGVATVAGAIPAAALARAAAAASEAGIELLPAGIRQGVNGFVGLPGVVAGLLRPSGENSDGC